MKRYILLFLLMAVSLCTALAQNENVNIVEVTGTVTDVKDEPLVGVTVSVRDKVGYNAITDVNGHFKLKAPQYSYLIFSYIGMETKTVLLKNQKVVNVKLEELKENVVDEVVVTGTGVQKKITLSGAVTTVNPEELRTPTGSLSNSFAGVVPGVFARQVTGQPGKNVSEFWIRGVSTFGAGASALVLVDGFERNLDDIAPEDIESFTVLKDASATAIYGSRASNGVIIITTKKGKKGSAPRVSYNGDVTISTVAKKYDALNATEYRNLVNSIEGLDASKLGNADTNWQDEIFRTAVSTSHNVSVSGGIGNIPYRVSAGYNSSQGIVKTSSMQRANAGLNVAPSLLNDHLNLNITAKYMYERDRYADAGGAIGSALSIDPTRPVYTNDETSKFFGGYYQPYVSANFSDPDWAFTSNANAPQNPLALLELKETKAKASDFTGNFEADYKIHGFEDLHIHASYGGQYTESKQTDDIANTSYSNNYYGWNGLTRYYKYSITANAYAQYQKELDAHFIDIMAGAEESHYHRHGFNEGQGTDPYNGEAFKPSIRSEQEWATHNSLVSYFGRLNYTLLDRYMLTATFRADGSSRFSEDNHWGYFPSVALAWKINEEKFMKDLTWWNEFKLRLGWGKTGQQELGTDEKYNPSYFGYAPLYVISNSYAQYPFGSTYYNTMRPNAYNPDLKWETTTTWNAGFDFGFLNNRISASLDGYYRKTTDLLNTVTIPVGTNFGSVLTQNIGSMKNYGIEFSINAKPIVTKDFTWDINYNISWNHNEITSLTEGADDDYYIKTGTTISRGNSTLIQANTVGKPRNSFFVYQQVYDANGKPIEGMYVDRNADGQINESDRYFYKSPAADVIMGFTTKFLYKNWDLSAAFHASLGNYVYYNYLSDKGSISSSGLYSNSAFTNTFPEAVELGFTGIGTEYYLSDYYVRNASYLKCSNITLGYTFPNLLKNHLNGRIFATVQNPFIITKYKGLDPEIADGVDKNPYPRPRSFQIGLSLNF